jgi:cobalt/nickel transport system permease protein
MGANILNMGVIGGFVGYYSFQGLLKILKNPYISSAVAAWLACLIPSLACAVEMYVAGTFPLVPGLVAMGLYHAIIGVIEGIVTAVIIYVLLMARPDLVETSVGVASA